MNLGLGWVMNRGTAGNGSATAARRVPYQAAHRNRMQKNVCHG